MSLHAHDDLRRLTREPVGGLADLTLTEIGAALHRLLGRDGSTIDRILADGLRIALAAHVGGSASVDRDPPPARSAALDSRRLQRVLDAVEARFAEPLSLDDLAAEACLSPFHFARLFRGATGLSPHRYVARRRLLAAQEMLAADRLPLVQVALAVGFESQASFTRAFRQQTGVTPGRYRRLRRR